MILDINNISQYECTDQINAVLMTFRDFQKHLKKIRHSSIMHVHFHFHKLCFYINSNLKISHTVHTPSVLLSLVSLCLRWHTQSVRYILLTKNV